MAVIETWFEQDLQKPVKVHYIDGNLFSHNGNGNRIGVIVTNNGEAVTLTGTVSGYAVLADGTTVPCTGTRSGNKASILVPTAAYSPGSILISIFLTDGTTVTTLAALSSSVIMARTGNQIDPGSVVTDWTNTINAAMQSVETAAANLGNIVATPYANLTFPVPLGKYTIYNNGLYRCISPIASSEAWTAAHWTNVKLGDDVADLKGALIPITDYTGQMVLNKAFITNNETVVDITNPSFIQTANGYCYVIVPCTTGDFFSIASSSASGAKGYMFLDAEGNVLEKKYSSDQSSVEYYNLYAPAKSSHLIVNARMNKEHYVRKGVDTKSVIAKHKKDIEDIQSFIGGSKIGEWQEGYAYYLSSSNLILFRPEIDENMRTCILEVIEGDVIYYSGSNYIDANDTTSAGRPFGFFDNDGNLVSFADSGIYKDHKIVIPSGVKYVVLNQHNYYGFQDCYIGSLPSKDASKDNDYSAINKTLNIVNNYMETSLHYDTRYSPWYYNESYGDERGMTCSDWGMVSFFGIDANFCKWKGMPNLIASGFDAYRDLYEFKSNNQVWSEQIAKYIDENYLSYEPLQDMSNVKCGDVLFFDLSPDNDNDQMYYPPTGETLTRYKGVDHCAVVLNVVSNDYYAVLEVAGSPQNDHGYVSFRYLPINSRSIVTALRPISYVKYNAMKLASFKPTHITKTIYHDITLNAPIPKNKWITVVVDADRYSDSFIGVQVKYVGSDTFSASVSSESMFGYGTNAKPITAFTFKTSNPIQAIRVTSFGNSSGQNVRGFYVRSIDIYDGFNK